MLPPRVLSLQRSHTCPACALVLDPSELIQPSAHSPALGDLRLVGGVLRVPAWVLQQVAQNHGRRDRVVITGANKRAVDFIATHNGAQLCQQLGLTARLSQLQRRTGDTEGRVG